MFIAQRLRLTVPVSVLLMLLSISSVVIAQSCPIVPDLVAAAAQMCADLNNEACVGTEPVLLQDSAGNPLSAAQGSRHQVASLGLVEPQLETAMVPFRVNWDEQALDFIIFGSVRTRNEIPVASAPITTAPLSAVVRTGDGSNANLRGTPDTSGAIESTIPSGATVTVFERSADSEWILISYTSDERILYGWVASFLLTNIDINTIPASAAIDAPWQSFNVTGNAQPPSCDNVPYGGVLLQSPEGSVVSFRVNGVLVYMGSTVLIRPLAGGGIRIINIEGNVAVRDKNGVVVNVTIGHYVEVNGAGSVSTTITQISYSDGQGVDAMLTLLTVRVFVPLPPVSSTGPVDVWACDHFQDGPGGVVTVSANQPILFASSPGAVEREQMDDFLSTFTGLVWSFNGMTLPYWGRSPIVPCDADDPLCHGSYNVTENGASRSVPYQPGDPGYINDPYIFTEYTVAPPQQAGSYRAEVSGWPGFCTIVVTGTRQVTVLANLEWQSTGIQLVAGQSITISASGQTNLHPGFVPDTGPEGRDGNANCPISGVSPDLCPIAGQPYGILVGRVGEFESFTIGTGTTYTVRSYGILSLTVNDHYGAFEGNSGSYIVEITINP